MVLSVSVESTMECQTRVNDVVCAVSFSGNVRSAIHAIPASVIFLMLMPSSADRTISHVKCL